MSGAYPNLRSRRSSRGVPLSFRNDPGDLVPGTRRTTKGTSEHWQWLVDTNRAWEEVEMGLQAQADRATDEEDLVPEDGGTRQPDELATEVRVSLQKQLDQSNDVLSLT